MGVPVLVTGKVLILFKRCKVHPTLSSCLNCLWDNMGENGLGNVIWYWRENVRPRVFIDGCHYRYYHPHIKWGMGSFTCLIYSICLPENIKLVGTLEYTSCAKLSLTESRIQVAVIMQTSQTFAIKSKVRLRASGGHIETILHVLKIDLEKSKMILISNHAINLFIPFNFLFQTKLKFSKHFSWKPV